MTIYRHIGHRSAFLLAVLFLFGEHAIHSANGQSSQNSVVAQKSEFDRAWHAIKHASPSDAESSREDSVQYWGEIMDHCVRVFDSMATGPDSSQNIEKFVAKFGEEGPQADMRWVLAAPETVIHFGAGCGLFDPDQFPAARKIQIRVAELQVRQFLKEPEKLKRYYQLVLWSGAMFDRPANHVACMNAHFRDDSDEYWWYARDFLLLAYATGREDLLEDVKPEELVSKYKKLRFWLTAYGVFLRPVKKEMRWHLDEDALQKGERFQPFMDKMSLPLLPKFPKEPFSDWRGSPAMPPRTLLGFT